MERKPRGRAPRSTAKHSWFKKAVNRWSWRAASPRLLAFLGLVVVVASHQQPVLADDTQSDALGEPPVGAPADAVAVQADLWDLLGGQAGSQGALGYARSDLPDIAALLSLDTGSRSPDFQSATIDFVFLLNELEAVKQAPATGSLVAALDKVSASKGAPTQAATASPIDLGGAPALVQESAPEDALSSQSLAARAQVASLSTRLVQQRQQVQFYRQRVAKLDQSAAATKAHLSQLAADKQALAQQLAAKQAQIDLQLMPDLRAARDGLLRLNARHRALVASQTQVQEALAEAQSRISEELEPQIATLKAREGTEVASLFDRLDVLGLERDIALFHARQLAAAFEEASLHLDRQLQPKVIDLSQQLASLGAERESLNHQVRSLNQAIEVEYRPMLQALERENVALQNRNIKLENQITRLEQDLKHRARQVRAQKGHIDPARCQALVARHSERLAAMTGLLALFQLEQLAPKDLRVIDPEESSAFDFVFNDLAAGWLLERSVDPFVSPDQQKMAALDSKAKKRRWSPLGSDNVLALQSASNAWLKRKGLTLAKIGLPATKGCSARLCLTGVVDSRTRIVASYIFDRDPSVFPGAVAQRSAKNAGSGKTRAAAAPNLVPGALLDELMQACKGQG